MEDENRGGDRATVDPIGQVSAPPMIPVDDGSGGKKKRGRPPRGHAAVTATTTAKKKVEVEEEGEDVCFICFDGGSLVLCDRRGCPKAYHPACIKRDEAFFQSKAKWNCGWHICSICQKASHHMCYTCTYSLCKTCAKDADYLSVRENKGLCVTCMKTIMLIEHNVPDNKDMVQVDFDDKSSWEYLFKVYWVYLKEKLSLTLDELIQAKKPCSEVGPIARKEQKLDVIRSISDCKSSISDVPSQHLEICGSKKRKIKKQLVLPNIEEDQSSKKIKIKGHRADISSDKSSTLSASTDWATKELFEFVAHMRNGDISVLSQFEVQSLLLEYIKKNNLRDPHRKSQIICDARLMTLFLKPKVGHFEMLKLLEYHFLIKEDNQKEDIFGNTVRAVPNPVEGGGNNESLLLTDKDKKRKFRKKGEVKGPQTNLDEFAAIDVHNINLIYLRRNLMENLVTTNGKFCDKVVGSVVRIRISGGDPKQDIYRLVQVIGTFKAAVPYKLGGKTVDVMLKILNLNKKELVAIDAISNQNFSEDECRRLRQSVKCGLVKQMTVGQVQEKAKALQEVRLNDWLETEILRLNHLRDRASENGRKKELRECVEKIELLKSPEERQRRLHETPQVHPDPKMDPKCESAAAAAGEISKRKQADPVKQRSSEFRKLGRDPVSIQNKNKQAKFSLSKGPSGRLGKQVHELHKRKEACVSKTPPVSLSNGSTPTEYKSETEKLWHYRDPNGNIQGPFCLVQLRKWSTSGYFPPDMRVWSINTDELDSLLLADVLNGNFNGALASRSNTSLPYQDKLFICEDRHSSTVNPTIVNDGKRSNGSWNCSSATSVHQMTVNAKKRWISGPTSENISSHKSTLHPNAGHESQSDNRPFSGQSSVESWRPLAVNVASNNSDSNFSLASVPKSTDSSDHLKINGLNLPSPTPVITNNGNLENDTSIDPKPSQSCAPVQDLGMEELPSPTPKPSDRDEKASLGIQNLPSPSPTMIDMDEKVDSSIGDSPNSLPNARERDEKVQATKSNPPCANQTSTFSTPTPSDIKEKADLFAKNLQSPSSKIVDGDEKVDSTVQNLPYSAPSFTCDSITPKPSDEKAGIGIQNLSGPSLMMVDDSEKVDSAIERLPSPSLNPGNGNKIVQANENKPPGTNLTFISSTPKPNDRDEKADTCILSSPSRKTDDEDRTVDSISQRSPSPSLNPSDGNEKVQTDEIKPSPTNLTHISSIAKPKDVDEKADTCILSSPSPKKFDDDRRADLTIQHTPSSSLNPSNENKKVQGNESKPPGTNLTFISSTEKSKDIDEKAATCILSSLSPKTNDEDRKVDPNLQTLPNFPEGPCNSNEKAQANESKQFDTCLTCTSSPPKPSDSDEKAATDIQNIPNPLSKTVDEDVKVDFTVQSLSTLTDENKKAWANENKPPGTSLTCSSSQPEPNYKKEKTGIDIQNFVSASAKMVDGDENPGSINQNLSTSPIYPKDRNEKAQAKESKPPDSSLICVSSTAEPSDRDEKANIVIQNLLSPKVVNGNEKVYLTSCPPNTSGRQEEVEAKESSLPNTRLSSNSGLVNCFGSHEKIANEKPPEVFSDQGVIPPPDCEQFAPSTSNHPCTTLNWKSFDYEPIEFSTLAEESVSDLLAEVDAMEAQGDVASPTSAMYSGDDFFEDHLFDFGKTDEVSSTGDSSSLPHQPAIVCEPLSISDYDIFDPTKSSIGEASTSSQAKNGQVDQNSWENTEGDINPGFGGLNLGMDYMVNVDMKQYSSFGFMGHERQSDTKGR